MLETVRLKRIKDPTLAPVAQPVTKPTAPVVGASVGAGIGALVVSLAAQFGHPLPEEAAITITTLFSMLAGFIHPRGRT